MSCDFTIEPISFPEGMADQVEALLKKHDLTDYFQLEETGLWSLSSDWGMNAASRATDDLLPDIAKLIQGTPSDGQVINTVCDGEAQSYILAGGKVHQPSYDMPLYVSSPGLPCGEERTITVKVKVIGIGKGTNGHLHAVVLDRA